MNIVIPISVIWTVVMLVSVSGQPCDMPTNDDSPSDPNLWYHAYIEFGLQYNFVDFSNGNIFYKNAPRDDPNQLTVDSTSSGDNCASSDLSKNPYSYHLIHNGGNRKCVELWTQTTGSINNIVFVKTAKDVSHNDVAQCSNSILTEEISEVAVRYSVLMAAASSGTSPFPLEGKGTGPLPDGEYTLTIHESPSTIVCAQGGSSMTAIGDVYKMNACLDNAGYTKPYKGVDLYFVYSFDTSILRAPLNGDTGIVLARKAQTYDQAWQFYCGRFRKDEATYTVTMSISTDWSQTANTCGSNPCGNNGICSQAGWSNYTCACITGITGRNCEINIDDCQGVQCQNGGTCVDGTNKFTCNCPTGFYGDECEFASLGLGTWPVVSQPSIEAEVGQSFDLRCNYSSIATSENTEITWNFLSKEYADFQDWSSKKQIWRVMDGSTVATRNCGGHCEFVDTGIPLAESLTIRITNVTVERAGLYMCSIIVENGKAQGKAITKVTVVFPPFPQVTIDIPSSGLYADDIINIICTSPKVAPNATDVAMSVFIGEEGYDEQTSVIGNGDETSKVIMARKVKVTKEDHGASVTCIASWRNRTYRSDDTIISVKYPPPKIITSTAPAMPVNENTKVTVMCNAEGGNPSPQQLNIIRKTDTTQETLGKSPLSLIMNQHYHGWQLHCNASGVGTRAGYIVSDHSLTINLLGKIDESCSANSDCTVAFSTCDSGTSSCKCIAGYKADSTNTICTKRKLGESCQTSEDCMIFNLNSECSTRNICQCTSDYVLSSDQRTCVEKRPCNDATEFSCLSGECIPKAYYNDGIRDCFDNTDEGDAFNCPRGDEFKCNTAGTAVQASCITVTWANDGVPDCTDGSDEFKHHLNVRCAKDDNTQHEPVCSDPVNGMGEGVFCDLNTRTCQCLLGFVANSRNTKCIKLKLYDACSVPGDCSAVIEHSTCDENLKICRCDWGYMSDNVTYDVCTKRVLGNHCNIQPDCTRFIPYAECNNNRCKCSVGLVANEENTNCSIVKLYDACSVPEDCSAVIEHSTCDENLKICRCDLGYMSNNVTYDVCTKLSGPGVSKVVIAGGTLAAILVPVIIAVALVVVCCRRKRNIRTDELADKNHTYEDNNHSDMNPYVSPYTVIGTKSVETTPEGVYEDLHVLDPVPPSSLKQGLELHRGLYTTTVLASITGYKHLTGGKEVVAKVVNGNCVTAKLLLASEVEALRKLKFHKHIAVYLGYNTTAQDPAFLLMERASQGNLLSYLLTAQQASLTLPPADLLHFVDGIISGLKHLHQHTPPMVMHVLNCSHVLLANNLSCQLAGFGFSRDVSLRHQHAANIKYTKHDRWLAPEVLSGGEHTEKGDLWSLGALLYEIFTLGNKPFGKYSDNAVKSHIVNGELTCMKRNDTLPTKIISTLQKCMVKDPDRRINLELSQETLVQLEK